MSSPAAPSSQLPLFHVVGFTGHRQLGDAAGVAKAITAELEELRRVAPGEWIALSSVAAGARPSISPRGGDAAFKAA